MQINQVKKAVIPAAGFGTRLFPATKVVKKEFFLITGQDGRAKPVILAIVEEAISAGITEVGTSAREALRPIIEAMGVWAQQWGSEQIAPEDLDDALLMWGMRRRINCETKL